MPEIQDPHAENPHYDVAVIGAGVIGCAIARQLTLRGARVIVLEKAAEVLDGASKGNSAILHTGFDAPVGTLEARLIAEGHREYRDIHERLGLPLMRTGALVIAWTAQEAARLPALAAAARQNGVEVRPQSAGETYLREPRLGPGVVDSFLVEDEGIIDAWSAPHAYLLQALQNGAALMRSCEVTGGAFDGTAWTLRTSQTPVRCAALVNAAGLYGDVLDTRLFGEATFSIRPRKGQFIVYDKPAFDLARHILLPVPTERTKGVVVCRTAWGNLLVGPTAEEQEERAAASLDSKTLSGLRDRAEAILPDLTRHEITASYAGLRPASEEKGYRIGVREKEHAVTVGGIRSTGLSAALGLGVHVADLCEPFLPPSHPLHDPLWPQMPNLSHGAPRDYEAPGNGGIVCHCELVTRREVEMALSGPLAARTAAGLKRRTRAMMGRCQGFYCQAELAAITAGRLAEPMSHPVGTDER